MKQQSYERIGILSLSDVIPHIEKNLGQPGKTKVEVKGFTFNTQSLRLKTFLKTGTTCPCCNIVAEFFAVERAKGSKDGFHINLYGYNENKEEVIFTHDHIISRALGGEDNLANSRTMCGPCNWEKGRIEYLLLKENSIQDIEKINQQLKKYKP
ncbi:HNH endonuclease [archaeon]|nr:HNH endonuclease [archaeon]NCQ50467.1 HNH endonuclease [archaeon]